jgi:hypothetical protein
MLEAVDFRTRVVPALVGVVWLFAVASGFAVLHRYESTPGAQASIPPDWPADAPFGLESGRLTLVVAVHPRCVCSRATAEELERLLASRPGRARVNLLIFKPGDACENWTRTPLVSRLSALPDTSCWLDPDGKLAVRFGAVVSGQILAFDSGGKLLYSGGITPLRGKAGPNAGYDSLAALLDAKPANSQAAPAYGCSLLPAAGRREGVQ